MASGGLGLADVAEHLTVPIPRLDGQVTKVMGMLIEGRAPDAAVGDLYAIQTRVGRMTAEVVALRDDHALLVPFGSLSGLQVGAALRSLGGSATIQLSQRWLGRVVDAMGCPLDGGSVAPLRGGETRPLYGRPVAPLQRAPVAQRLTLGVRALDAFVPCGRGQRLGIFSGPGVGKSVLVGMLSRATAAEVTVLALVGERGREVGHFVECILGEAGLKNAVVVVATSDRPPQERIRAAFLATTVAEYLRDCGKHVMLFVDSLTRFCMAQREIGLAVGEPPTTKGYPPSTFSVLPQLLERAGAQRGGGSVTGVYSVLVQGDDLGDPVADAARGLLDGHVVLSRELAAMGHFPAIDVLQSVSRLQGDLLSPQEKAQTSRVREWLARLHDARDLMAVGAYQPGGDPMLDQAVARKEEIYAFLRQGIDAQVPLAETQAELEALAGAGGHDEAAAARAGGGAA